MSKRIKWLDFGKGFTILLVVLVHCFTMSGEFHGGGPINYALTIIAMPLFFAISGYLYRPSHSLNGYLILLYKKISSFIIPYIFFSVLLVLLHISYSNNLLFHLSRIYITPIGYLWFLYALFFMFIIIGFMNLFRISLFIQIIIALIFLFGQMYLPWQESSVGNINPLAGIGGYMICFYIGYIIKRNHIENILSNNKISVSLITLWLVLFIAQIFITGSHYTNLVVLNYTDLLTKLISIPAFFTLFILFNNKSKIFKYFDKYGKFTFIIYLVHFPVIVIGKEIFKIGITNHLLLFVMLLIIGWYSSVIVYYLSKHIPIIDFVFYPRKYFNKILSK